MGIWNANHTKYSDITGDKFYDANGQEISAAQYRANNPSLFAGDGSNAASGNPFAVAGGADQLAGSFKDMGSNLLTSLGWSAPKVDPNAPGASLDTSQADQTRGQLNPLMEFLQQQATTGGGAWEKSLADSTGRAASSVQALGQSMPGSSYQSDLHNIGNGQAAVGQRAVGQGNVLRAQAQQGAQSQLSNLYAAQGSGDANQAAAAGAANQGTRDLQNSLNQQADQNFGGAMKSASQAVAMGASSGGKVPGKPQVFGDDSRNDTTPAWLSPGEIVIPISHAGSPEDAAEFVRQLQASRGAGGGTGGVQHFDGGGQVDSSRVDGTGLDANHSTLLGDFGSRGEAPSVQNGGLLETGPYNANRTAALGNAALIGARAMGPAGAIPGQQMQDSTDSNIAAAMQGGRGGAANTLAGFGAAQSGAGGNAAELAAQAQHGGADAFAHALLAQRASDNAFAQAQQQAAFRNTQMNAGLGLAQQAQLRSILGGAGQAAAALASTGEKSDSFTPGGQNTPEWQGSFTPEGGSSPSEWEDPYASGRGSASDLSGGENFAEGGRVQASRAPVPRSPHADRPLSRFATRKAPGIVLENGREVDEEPKSDEPLRAGELSVQMAHGGRVEMDEAQRASDFLAALKRQRRAA